MIGIVVSALLVLTSFGLLAGGTVASAVEWGGRDDDGYVTSGRVDVGSPGHAVVTDNLELHTDAAVADLPRRLIGTVAVEAEGQGGSGVFVGIARTEDVSAYLHGVATSTVVDLRDDGSPVYQHRDGGVPPTSPGAQDFWTASHEGTGLQRITFDAEEGDWTLVVMNADGGEPVEASVRVGATLPILKEAAIVLLAAGATLLVLAGAGLWLTLRQRPLRQG